MGISRISSCWTGLEQCNLIAEVAWTFDMETLTIHSEILGDFRYVKYLT